MSKLLANTKLQHRIELIFKLLFLVYTMLSFNNVFYGSSIISVVLWPTAFLGALLLLWRLTQYKNFYRMPALGAMIAFLLSFSLSMLLNHQYGFKDNFIVLIYLVFYFLMFYLTDDRRSKEDTKKEFLFFAWVIVIYMAVCTIAGLVEMFMGYSHIYTTGTDDYEVIAGFMWGRLWGVFLDPNVAGILCIFSCFYSVYLIRYYRKKLPLQILLGINIAIQVVYIAFTDSRTALVSTLGGVAACLFVYQLYHKPLKFSKVALNVVISLVVATAIAILPTIVLKGYNELAEQLSNNQNSTSDNSSLPAIERNYSLDGDVSNRRFEIWGSGFEIFKEEPIFGTSYYGIRPYAEDHLPDTYIINNSQTDFRNLHNEVVNIAVSQGVIGLAALAWMCISILVYFFRRIRKIRQEDIGVVSILMGALVTAVCSVMFLSAGMFYFNAPGTPMFWLMLGYLMHIVRKSSQEEAAPDQLKGDRSHG